MQPGQRPHFLPSSTRSAQQRAGGGSSHARRSWRADSTPVCLQARRARCTPRPRPAPPAPWSSCTRAAHASTMEVYFERVKALEAAHPRVPHVDVHKVRQPARATSRPAHNPANNMITTTTTKKKREWRKEEEKKKKKKRRRARSTHLSVARCWTRRSSSASWSLTAPWARWCRRGRSPRRTFAVGGAIHEKKK